MLAVEAMFDGYALQSAVRDPSGKIVDFRYEYLNDAACRALQLPRERIVGKLSSDVVPGSRDLPIFQRLCEVVRTGEAMRETGFEIALDWDGTGPSTKVFDLLIMRAGDGCAAIWHEITERIGVERELARSEARLRAIIDHLPAPASLCGPDGRYLLVNGFLARAAGRAPEELVGRYPGEADPGMTAFNPSDLAELNRTKRPILREMTATLADGSERDYETLLYPVIDAGGAVSGFGSCSVEVTERRRLAREVEQRAALIDLAHDAVIVREPVSSAVTYWNREAADIYQYSVEEALGRVTHDLLATEFPDSREAVDDALLAQGRWDGELRHRRKDGAQLVISSRQALMRDEHGEPVAVLELNSDITERKEAEDELRRVATIVDAAHTLQRSILGPVEQDLPSGVAAHYQPGVRPLEVGGDWYDVINLPAGRLGLIVGDCVGRGIGAAAVMGQLRSVSHSLMLQGKTPREVLDDLDLFAQRIPGARCTTVFCALVDPAAGTARYSSAGHPPAVLVHRSRPGRFLDEALSIPLAIPGADRREASARLTRGSTLALYTDGLVERRGVPVQEGLDRLLEVIEADRERPIDSLISIVIEKMQAAGSEDDVAVLLYRLQPTGP
jgi:PAS domain S-box-containing protein